MCVYCLVGWLARYQQKQPFFVLLSFSWKVSSLDEFWLFLFFRFIIQTIWERARARENKWEIFCVNDSLFALWPLINIWANRRFCPHKKYYHRHFPFFLVFRLWLLLHCCSWNLWLCVYAYVFRYMLPFLIFFRICPLPSCTHISFISHNIFSMIACDRALTFSTPDLLFFWLFGIAKISNHFVYICPSSQNDSHLNHRA